MFKFAQKQDFSEDSETFVLILEEVFYSFDGELLTCIDVDGGKDAR